MRSRYSAFAVGNVGFLRDTWHPSTRPARLTLPRGGNWTRLRIAATTRGGVFDTEGTVEFEASYEVGGQVGVQRETSRFVRENRRWYYLGDNLPPGAAGGELTT